MGTDLIDNVRRIKMQSADAPNEECLATVRRLLDEGTDLDARDHQGRTALHLVVQGCMGITPMTLAHELLDAGARAENIDDNGVSLLASASGARGEHFDDPEHNVQLLALVQRLVEAGASVDSGMESPLATSVSSGREALMLWLLAQGAKADGTLKGRSALQIAAAYPNTPLAMVEALAMAGAELSPVVFLEAVQTGRVEAVELLTQHGATASASFQAEDGRTFLHAAATSGNVALTKTILAAGPNRKVLDAKTQKTKRTALMEAIRTGHEDIARCLLDAKAKVKGSDTNRFTVLHFAAEAGLAGLIPLLIERGADLDKVDYDKQTPLHVAAFRGQLGAARALLAAGYSPAQADRDGNTPRTVAKLNSPEVLAFFDSV